MAKPKISYQLQLDVAHPIQLQIGRLGTFLFPAGRYVYTGSAKRILDARIARHRRKEKLLRWHIDWLLAAPGVEVVNVTRFTDDECVLNQRCGGVIAAPGFGASDCRHGCGSHLQYWAS